MLSSGFCNTNRKPHELLILAILIWITGFLHSGCTFKGARDPSEVPSHLNQNKEELIQQLKARGQLKEVQTSRLNPGYEVVSAQDDSSYFIQGHKVVSAIRSPKHHEQKLMYWRMAFMGRAYREIQLKAQVLRPGHEPPVIELACDSLGQGVLYDPAKGRVTRVFYYANP